MIIYPAMDLMGGRCVRLSQGRFEDVTTYSADPTEALAAFAGAGAEWSHVVDLDGARAREPIQHDLIASLAGSVSQKLQVAGGFRTREHISRMLDAGAGRIVIGSLAVSDPERVNAFITEFSGDRIALALDVNVVDGTPMVATHGWTEDSGLTLWKVAALYPSTRHLLVTDIGRDGMLSGPNFALLDQVAALLPHLEVQASGGISSLDDVKQLRTAGTIVGKALWEGRIDLKEAIHLARA